MNKKRRSNHEIRKAARVSAALCWWESGEGYALNVGIVRVICSNA